MKIADSAEAARTEDVGRSAHSARHCALRSTPPPRRTSRKPRAKTAPETEKRTAQFLREVSEKFSEAAAWIEARNAARNAQNGQHPPSAPPPQNPRSS